MEKKTITFTADEWQVLRNAFLTREHVLKDLIVKNPDFAEPWRNQLERLEALAARLEV